MTGFANTTWPVKDISREENPKVPFSLLFAVVVIILLAIWVKAGFSIHRAKPADRKKAEKPQAAIHCFFISKLHIRKKRELHVLILSLFYLGIAENQEIDDNSERFSENC